MWSKQKSHNTSFGHLQRKTNIRSATNRLTDEMRDRWTDRQNTWGTDGLTDRWDERQMTWGTDGWTNRWHEDQMNWQVKWETDGLTDKRQEPDGLTDRWTDIQMKWKTDGLTRKMASGSDPQTKSCIVQLQTSSFYGWPDFWPLGLQMHLVNVKQ